MTKFPSKVIWNLRDSLDRAKARATGYYKRLRLLEIKVRDLERSRDAWKGKCKQMTEIRREADLFPPGN